MRMDGGTVLWQGGGTEASPFKATPGNDFTGGQTGFKVVVSDANVQVTVQGDNTLGMAAGRRHQFHARAVNKMGPGVWSDWSSSIDEPRGYTLDKPEAPGSWLQSYFGRFSCDVANYPLCTDQAVAGTIKIAWTSINTAIRAGRDNLGAIKYEVWGNYAGLPLVQQTMADDANNYHEQTVVIGQKFHFKARAKNSGWASAWSNTIELVSASVPDAVSSLALTSTTNGQVVMAWGVPNFHGGSAIQKYEVSYDNFDGITAENPCDMMASLEGGGQYVCPAGVSCCEVPGTATTHTFISRSENLLETYSVRAVNSVGASTVLGQSIVVCCAPR